MLYGLESKRDSRRVEGSKSNEAMRRRAKRRVQGSAADSLEVQLQEGLTAKRARLASEVFSSRSDYDFSLSSHFTLSNHYGSICTR